MDLKDGDQIIWCYDDRGNDIKAAMVFKKLKRIGQQNQIHHTN